MFLDLKILGCHHVWLTRWRFHHCHEKCFEKENQGHEAWPTYADAAHEACLLHLPLSQKNRLDCWSDLSDWSDWFVFPGHSLHWEYWIRFLSLSSHVACSNLVDWEIPDHPSWSTTLHAQLLNFQVPTILMKFDVPMRWSKHALATRQVQSIPELPTWLVVSRC